MARRDIEAGRAYVSLGVRKSGFDAALARAKSLLAGFARGAGIAFGALSAAAGAVVGSITAAVTQFAAISDRLGDLSARTGIAASSLAALEFAAQQSGATIADLEIGIRNMQRTLGKKSGGLSPERQFMMIADSIAAIEDPSKRAAEAMRVFGRSGTRLLPLLAGGEKGIAELRKEAERLGVVFSERDISIGRRVADAWDKVRSVMRAATFHLGAAFGPLALRILEVTVELAAKLNFFFRNLRPIFLITTSGIREANEGLRVMIDLLAKVGASLLGADFAGAWKTAVESMKNAWDVFMGAVQASLASLAKRLLEAVGGKPGLNPFDPITRALAPVLSRLEELRLEGEAKSLRGGIGLAVGARGGVDDLIKRLTIPFGTASAEAGRLSRLSALSGAGPTATFSATAAGFLRGGEQSRVSKILADSLELERKALEEAKAIRRAVEKRAGFR